MRDLLFILITMGLTTCQNASYNQETSNASSENGSGGGPNGASTGGTYGGKNYTSADDFMSDSRFRSGTSPWTFSPQTARSRIVETKYGRVQGLSITLFSNIHYTGRNFPLKNKIVEIFFGLPYAASPTKSHRFSPTQTPIPWNDVRPAIQPSAVCPQIFPDIRNESAALKDMPKGYLEWLRRVEPYLRNQSEDCLYLSIYSSPEPNKLKPVLIYFHGGNFAWGSGNLSDGTVLAAYADVIFITLNFRLGILGFLNLNDSPNTKPRVSNFGLMDQIAALHWIKENIRNFGGDPDNITLLGYEAGAACINFLMTSPAVSPGLFHRSILIAGSSFAPWSLVDRPSEAAFTVAQALNCTSGNSTSPFNNSPHAGPISASGGQGPTTTSTTAQPSRESHHIGISSSSPTADPVLECLKSKHYSEFTKFPLPKFSVDFGPSVDGIVIKPNFRSSLPPQMGKREVNKKYDLLFGLSSLEKLTEFSEMDLEFGFESMRRDAILRTLVRNSFRYHRNEILATITNEYIDWEKSVQHPVQTRDLAVNAVTDCLSLAPVVAVTESSQIKKSFFYIFEHSTRDGLYNYQRAGAGGGEELNYIFGSGLVEAATGQVLPFIPPPLPSNYSKIEIGLSELWMTYISNFAHSGNPNGPVKIDSVSTWPVSKERNRYKNSAWEPYDRLHQKYLEIGANKVRIRSHYRAHQMAIWLRLVPELQRSGAQMASTLHNRMKGDPALYTGRVRPEEEVEEPESPGERGLLSPSQMYDLLLGYGGYGDPSQALPELVETAYDLGQEGPGGTIVGGDNEITNTNKSPTLTLTTCFSPVSSSVQESSIKGGGGGGGNSNSGGSRTFFPTGTAGLNETSSSFFDSAFPPYALILAITIAVGLSLLILNISIFALVYFQRDRRRAKLRKSAQQDSETQLSHNKYSEPPELLKSNRTTASSFLQNSHSQGQLQAELEALELTVKQHQQELLGEKALLGKESLSLSGSTNIEVVGGGGGSLVGVSVSGGGYSAGTESVRQSGFPKQQQQLPHSYSTQTLPRDYYRVHGQADGSQRAIGLSPGRSTSNVNAGENISVHGVSGGGPSGHQTLAVATLPRCNGNIVTGTGVGNVGMSSFIAAAKPNPPPRSAGHFSTLPTGHQFHGSLKREKRVDYGDNSDSNNENDELKV